MSKRIYEATILQLRATGTAALASIEAEFRSPHPDIQTIIELTSELTECENAITALNGYIGPQFEPPQIAPPVPVNAPPPSEQTHAPPLVVTPDMSATMRREIANQKIKNTATPKTKKAKKKTKE